MYNIYLIKPTTGQILETDGNLFTKGSELSYTTSSDNLKDTLALKDELLTKVIWATVLIHDDSTKKETLYSNEDVEAQYISETEQWHEYLVLPWYKKIFINKPEFKYLKTT